MDTNKMTACYFPTSVVFVDDSKKYLDHITLELKLAHPLYRFFYSPIEATKFLLNDYFFDSFTRRCTFFSDENAADQQSIYVDYSLIHKEIYQTERYNQISVIVADYAMPGMNGAELCQLLKNQSFKVILLTGEANHNHAVELFNNGTIHYFLQKNTENLAEKLLNSINTLQNLYFHEQSKIAINSLIAKQRLISNDTISFLEDPAFKFFFETLLKKHKITEYYLFDDSGNFLFLNNKGNVSWLIIQNENQIADSIFESTSTTDGMPANLLNDLKNKKMLRYFFNHHDLPKNANDWQRFVYPATMLMGQNNYYYSYITEPLSDPKIDKDRIMSYQKFRLKTG